MLCDECGKREASLFVRLMLSDSSLEVNLCDECARAKAVSGLYFDLSVGEIAEESADPSPPLFDAAAHDSVCPKCGLTAAELAREKRVGCAVCYEAHAEALKPILEVMQGITPQAPPPSSDGAQRQKAGRMLAELEAQLKQAVELEEYDRAVVLRDRIRELRQALGV